MINFRRGFWRHVQFMDICVELLAVSYVGENYTKLKIIWWNKGYVQRPYKIDPRPRTIKIMKDDYKYWKRTDLYTPNYIEKQNQGEL